MKCFVIILAIFVAGASMCQFECPPGQIMRYDPSHVKRTNGCGSDRYNLPRELLVDRRMEKCCDAHDHCYETCGMPKDNCEKEFQKCLGTYCYEAFSDHQPNSQTGFFKMWWINQFGGAAATTSFSGCAAQAKFLHETVVTVGCNAYMSAQRNACVCGN